MKPVTGLGYCLSNCPHAEEIDGRPTNEVSYVKCAWLNKKLVYYDGWLTDPICYSLSWAQSVLEAHRVKGKAPRRAGFDSQ